MALKQDPVKVQQGSQELEVIDFNSLKELHGIEDAVFDTSGVIDFEALRNAGKIEIFDPTFEGIEKPQPPKQLITKDDKEERIREIDADVNRLEGELRTFNEGLYSELGLEDELRRKERKDEAHRRAMEIRELTGERERLRKELAPVPQKTKDEITESVANNQYLDMVDKYDEDLVHQSLSERRSDNIGSYYESRYKNVKQGEFDTKGMKFDFAYLLHADRAPLEHKHTTKEEAQDLWMDIRDDITYRESNHTSRAALINTRIQQYVTEKFKPTAEGETVDENKKKATMAELQEYMIDQYMFTDEGGLSNNGVQTFARYFLSIGNDYLTELRKEQERAKSIITKHRRFVDVPRGPVREISKAIERSYVSPDIEKDDRKSRGSVELQNAEYYERFLDEEIQRTNAAMKFADKIVKAPTSPSLSTFGQGLFRSHSPVDLLTLGLTEMVDALGLAEIATKQLDGRELTHAEDMMMAMYLGLQEADKFERREIQIGNTDIKIKPENIGKNITKMVPYIASFAVSGGVYRATAGAVTKGTTRAMGKKLTSQALFKYAKGQKTYTLGDLAAKNMGRVVGAAAQTAALPQFYVEHTAKRIFEPGETLSFDPESQEILGSLTRNDVRLGTAAKRGYWEAYSEIFTERAGLHLMKPFRFAGKKAAVGIGKGVRKITGKEAAQLSFVKYLKQMKGITTNSQFNKLVVQRKLGWHGAAEEYMEELANLFMASVGTKDPIEFGEGKFLSNQLETFLTVAIFGGAANLGQYTIQEAIGDDIRFKKKDGTSFKLPYQVYKAIKAVYDAEGDFDGQALADALAPYKDKLTPKQSRGIMDLTLQNILKRHASETVEKTEDKTNIIEGFESEETTTEPADVRPKLSKAEQKQVDDFNRNIEEKFPDLVQADMIPKDPETGQYERPDAEWLISELEDVENELAAKVKRGVRSGEVVNRTDEIRDLEHRQSVLRNYLHAFKEYSAIPWSDLIQSEKFEVLSNELRIEGPQEASLDYIAGQETLGIKLNDRRVLRGRWAPEIEKKDRPAIGKRARAGEKFQLRIERKEQWDPDNKFPEYDRERNPDAPFPGDRIAIYDNKNSFTGVVYTQNYRGEEKARAEKYREITDKFKENLTGAAAFGMQWLADAVKTRQLAVPDPDLANEFRNRLFGLIDSVGELAHLSISDIINTIKRAIRESRHLLEEHKKFLLDMVDENIDLITGHIVQLKRRLGEQVPNIKVRAALTHARDLRLKNSEAVTMTGAAKIEENLRTFAPLWRELAEDLGVGRDIVEKTFYELALAQPLTAPNEDMFQIYLDQQKSDDRIQNAIIEKLRSLDFGTVVSLFNFYENVRLIPQFGIYISDKGLQRKELNPPINLEEFINSFINRTDSYTYTNKNNRFYKGIEAVQARIKDHREYIIEITERFMDQTPERRTEIRREIHEADLQLLNELTGISADVWEDYFSQRTRETVAFTSPDLKEQQDYASYDKLLEKDSYRPGKKGAQPRVQSVLMGYLTFMIHKDKDGHTRTPEEYREAYNAFFTEGNEERNVFSNLYKLSTASTSVEDIGLRGFDIKDDQFSSFLQFSHILKIIDEEGLDFVIQNGMRNIQEKKQGTQAMDMTLEDIWISAFSLFLENPDSYYQNIGQFGDKPAIYYVKVDKDKSTKSLPKVLEEAADYLYKEYLLSNQSFFIEPTRTGYTGSAASYAGENTNEKLKNLARDFVRSYATNAVLLNKKFHGNLDMYAKFTKEGYIQYETAFIDMVKRAASSNSPGYRPNRYVDGGIGTSYNFAILNDNIEQLGEIFDGVVFMSEDYAQKMAVSMGDIYFKPEEYEELSSAKILSSFIDPETGNRSLTKGNWLNIAILAEALPDSAYADIQKLMKKNGIDVLSFTSTNKKLEKGRPASQFNKDGRITNFTLPKESKLSRSTENLFVQQDLRHNALPKDSKNPIQFLANMLILPNAPALIDTIYSYQQMILNGFQKDLEKKEELTGKIDWILKNTNPHRDREIWELLFSGMLPTEPALQALLRTKLSSEVTSRALEIIVNRATTQEVPDPNGILKGRRRSKDGNHILLPQAGVSFPDVGTESNGVRYPQKMRSQEEAIAHVNAQKDFYADLFMPDGTLMEWEIEDGVIPGEVIMLTRIPADHPHSHTIARATIKIPGGNFTMLDKESQIASGSDFDGDYRFNTVFYKSRNGNILMDNRTRKGQANRILYNTMLDYMNPEYDAYIRAGIDTKAYSGIVDRWKKVYESGKYKSNDPRAFEESRQANMIGVTLKGILTDLNTIFSLVSYLQVPFKHALRLDSQPNIRLTGVINDHYGMMKIHLANLQNMAFDNAKDPGLGYMGLNEISAQMFVLALIGNKDLDSRKFKNAEDHYKAITNAIDQLSDLFNTDLYREFMIRMRNSKGANGKGTASSIFYDLGASQPEIIGTLDPREMEERGYTWSTQQADNLRDFFYAANELSDIRTFFNLTRKAPMTSADFYMARQSIKKIKLSSIRLKKGQRAPRNSFSLFDTSPFYTKSGQFHKLFRIIDTTMAISESVIFNDAFEHTRVGQQMMRAIWDRIKKVDERKTDFTRNELRLIIRSLNTVVAAQALEPTRDAKYIERVLAQDLNNFRKKFKGNKFFDYIQKQKYHDPTPSNKANKTIGIEIKYDYRKAGISEEELDRIRVDFDKLPKKLKNAFMQYAFFRWGTATTTGGGSYYTLMGKKYRIELSRMVWNQLERWKNDDLSPEEKLDILEMTLKNIFDEDLRKLSIIKPDFAREIDPTSSALIDFPISNEALESMTTDLSEQDLAQVASEFNFNLPEFREYAEQVSGSRDIFAFSRVILRKRERIAAETFGQFKPTDRDVQNMMPSDALGEAFASEDPALLDYIFNHLSNAYPGVQFFTSREAFYEFVRRNGGRLMDVETTAIGHAFANAVFIDPEKAVQSTLLHEYGHIYWDALPEDHPAKEALRAFYMNNTDETFADLDELDERIIVDLGKLATNRARIQFKGSALQRLMQLIKDFWREVKKLLGVHSGKDILTDLAIDLWSNTANIEPLTAPGKAVVRNMIKHTGNVTEEKAHGVAVGKKHFIGATRLKSLFKNVIYDSVENAKREMARVQEWYEKMTKQQLPEEIIEREIHRRVALDTETVESGSDIHKIAEHVFGDEPLDLTEVEDRFVSEIAYQNALKSFQDLKKWLESDLFKLYAKDVLGYKQEIEEVKFYTEYKIADTEFGVTGVIDLIIDLGNNNLIIADFKTTKFSYLNDKGEFEESYTATFQPYKNPIGFLSESIQNDHRLQLHTYKKLIENIKDPQDPEASNKVVGMMVIPVLRNMGPESLKIALASIPKFKKAKKGSLFKIITISPTEKRLTRATNLMFESAKKTVDSKNEDLQVLEEKLIEQEMDDRIITDMKAAFDFFETFLPNGLKEAYGIDIEGIRSNGWTGILSRLPDLGYTKDDLIGPAKLTTEELFWASVRQIRKEDLDKEFIEYEVYSRFVKHELDEAPPKGWYRHNTRRGDDNTLDSEQIIYDAGFKELEEGDDFLQIYPLSMKSGVQEYPTHRYKVVSVTETHNGLRATVVALDENGDEHEFKDILPDDGIHKIHPADKPVPGGVEIKDKFVPRYYYTEEKYKERHFNIGKTEADFGNTQDQRAAWASYRSSMSRMWAFFNRYDTIPKLRKFLNDQDAVSEMLEDFKTTNPQVTGALTELIRQTALNHHFAEYMRRENEFGPRGLMPVTLELYYIINNQDEVLYQDFPQWYQMLPERMISLQYIPFSMMQYTIMAALRRVQIESYDHNIKSNELLDQDLDLQKMIEMDPHTEIVKWVHPDDPSVQGTKEAEALEYIYSMHAKYNPDYRLLMEEKEGRGRRKYPKKIPVSKSFMTRKEFQGEYGTYTGALLHHNLKNSTYDQVKIPLRKVVKRGRRHYYPVDRDNKGNPIMVTLRDIKDKYIAENLDPTGIRRYFGNRWGQFLMRQKITGTLPRTLLAEYVRDARERYKTKSKKNNLGYDIQQHKRRIVRADLMNPKYSTNHMFEGEIKAIDKMIFRHYMKNTLGPLEYTISQYAANTQNNFAGEWLRNWTDKILFNIHPYMENDMWRIAFDFLKRLNSLNKIAFSIKTQVTNFMVGQTFDTIFEPEAYRKGLTRLMDGGPVNVVQNIRKARKILKRYGIVNIVDEKAFDKLEEQYFVGALPIHKLENAGYSFMDYIEKVNQFPIFIGLMTDQEWDAYTQDGDVKTPSEVLSDIRIHQIALRVRSIHGDYGSINAAPMWNMWWVDALLQFRKWGPALAYRYFHKHRFSQEFIIDSGMIDGLNAVFKIIKHNFNTKKYGSLSELEMAQKRVEEAIGEEASPLFIKNVQHYVDMLIEKFEGESIRFRDLPKNELKAIKTAVLTATIPFITTMMFRLGATLINQLIGDDDEEIIKTKKLFWKMMRELLQRHYGDVWYLGDMPQWKQTAENMVPFLSLLLGMGKMIADTVALIGKDGKARYSKDTFKYKEGTPKVLMDMFLVLPAGSFMRQFYSAGHLIWMRRTYEKVRIPFEEPLELGRETELTRFKVQEYSQMYQEIGWAMKKYLQSEGLMDLGIEFESYLEGEAAKAEIHQTVKKYSDAEKMLGLLVLAKEDPDVREMIEGAIENEEDFRKIFGYVSSKSDKQKNKALEEFLLEIEEAEENNP